MALRMARRIFDVAMSLKLKSFTIVDIGGGFPGVHSNDRYMYVSAYHTIPYHTILEQL